jgi:hypothetical protein
MIEEVEKVLVLLKPKASSDNVLLSIQKSNLAFHFDKIISMGELGDIIAGSCTKSVQESIKKLSDVDDIEKSETVTIQ